MAEQMIQAVFLMAVIMRIESMGGERVGGGSRWGAVGGLKQTEMAVLCQQ